MGDPRERGQLTGGRQGSLHASGASGANYAAEGPRGRRADLLGPGSPASSAAGPRRPDPQGSPAGGAAPAAGAASSFGADAPGAPGALIPVGDLPFFNRNQAQTPPEIAAAWKKIASGEPLDEQEQQVMHYPPPPSSHGPIGNTPTPPAAIPTPKPSPAPPAATSPIVTVALDYISHPHRNPNNGTTDWDNWCLGFVSQVNREAHGGRGDPQLAQYSAKNAYFAMVDANRLSRDLSNIPAGAAIYWPNASFYGHIAIYSGNKSASGDPLIITSTGWNGWSGVKLMSLKEQGLGPPTGWSIY